GFDLLVAKIDVRRGVCLTSHLRGQVTCLGALTVHISGSGGELSQTRHDPDTAPASNRVKDVDCEGGGHDFETVFAHDISGTGAGASFRDGGRRPRGTGSNL